MHAEDSMLHRSLGYLLSASGRWASTAFADLMRHEADLHPRHFAVLTALLGDDEMSQRALAGAVGLPDSRLVALVDELQRRGWLERRPREQDRRTNVVRLTDLGRQQTLRLLDAARALDEDLAADLTPDERTQLMTLLSRALPSSATQVW